jgi:ParB-like chromosome segregation protein Spo0J
MQTPTPTLHVEFRQIDQLLPYVRNVRTHSAVQIRQIAASIAEFGFNNPVLIDAEGSIIAGHGCVLAAGELKLPHVPVIVLPTLPKAKSAPSELPITNWR